MPQRDARAPHQEQVIADRKRKPPRLRGLAATGDEAVVLEKGLLVRELL